MIGVILLAVVGVGYETWALVYRRKHAVSTWTATISEGVWTLLCGNKWLKLGLWLGLAVVGAHLAFGVP